MILHCVTCSDQGKRLSPQSEVAEIIEDRIKLPLDASMFKGLQSERGLPDWPMQDDWQFMNHGFFNHRPWLYVLSDAETRKMVEQGGPSELITDQGVIHIDENGIIGAENNEEHFVCDVCNKPFETKRQLQGHKMGAHKDR